MKWWDLKNLHLVGSVVVERIKAYLLVEDLSFDLASRGFDWWYKIIYEVATVKEGMFGMEKSSLSNG